MDAITEKYVRTAYRAGCPTSQIETFLEAGIALSPRQLAASAAARLCDKPCTHREGTPCTTACGPTKVGYGGARGGGKSHWGLAQVYDDCNRFPGLKFLYLRKIAKAGKEAIHDLRQSVYKHVENEWIGQNSSITFPKTGSRCILGNFQTPRDIDKYLGIEYDGLLIEEATQLTKDKNRDILTCLRTSKPGWRPRAYYTTNPGNCGHAWFKELFIAPLRKKREIETRFIQATVYDNPFVNRENRAELEKLTGWQRRAWLLGDWDVMAGQYYSTWRNNHHTGVFEAQPHWTYWLSFDYGFTHNTAVTLLAMDDDGFLYIIDQHVASQMLPEVHAWHVDMMLARYGIDRSSLWAQVGGKDMFSVDQFGGSKADAYSVAGFNLTQARIERKEGAWAILRRLGDPDHEKEPRRPTMIVHERCTRLIECLPNLSHSELDPEDVQKVDSDEDGGGGDDTYDSLRYGVMEIDRLRTNTSQTASKKINRYSENPHLRGHQ